MSSTTGLSYLGWARVAGGPWRCLVARHTDAAAWSALVRRTDDLPGGLELYVGTLDQRPPGLPGEARLGAYTALPSTN